MLSLTYSLNGKTTAVDGSLFYLNETYSSAVRPTKHFDHQFSDILERLGRYRFPPAGTALLVFQIAGCLPTGQPYHHLEVYEMPWDADPTLVCGELSINRKFGFVEAHFNKLPKNVRCLKFSSENGKAAEVYLGTEEKEFYGIDMYEVTLIHRAWLRNR